MINNDSLTLVVTIEAASVINLSEASGQIAEGLFIHLPTIDTLVTGMVATAATADRRKYYSID